MIKWRFRCFEKICKEVESLLGEWWWIWAGSTVEVQTLRIFLKCFWATWTFNIIWMRERKDELTKDSIKAHVCCSYKFNPWLTFQIFSSQLHINSLVSLLKASSPPSTTRIVFSFPTRSIAITSSSHRRIVNCPEATSSVKGNWWKTFRSFSSAFVVKLKFSRTTKRYMAKCTSSINCGLEGLRRMRATAWAALNIKFLHYFCHTGRLRLVDTASFHSFRCDKKTCRQ